MEMGAYLSTDTTYGNSDLQPWMLSIVKFLPWRDRQSVMMLNKRAWINTNNEKFYRVLCRRLAMDHGVFVPIVPPKNAIWRALFKELYLLRSLWSDQHSQELIHTADKNDERSTISVYARFRPFDATAQKGDTAKMIEGKNDGEQQQTEEENASEMEVTLPLHQRLAMIRMSHNLKSNKQALKILAAEGGWFQDMWTGLAEDEKENEKENCSGNVQQHHKRKNNAVSQFCYLEGNSKRRQHAPVVATAKPEKVIAKVQSLDENHGRVVVIAPDVGLREFSFDGVFPFDAPQQSVYDGVMRRLVMEFMNGFNSTAIVYGQTGSGKTYSMFGKDDASIYTMQQGAGIVPRACDEVFTAMQQRQVHNQIQSSLAVSYIEIYGDQVSDLLRHGSRCGHSKVASQRYVLNGAAEAEVNCMEDIAQILQIGEQQKRRAATAMNDRSTRAHSLFILTLRQTKPGTDVTLHSRLFLADLGGSEQVKKSKVEAGVQRAGTEGAQFSVGFELGAHMREAVYINLGLLALKKCIESLNNRAPHVPYSDSKLTLLLSEGLGGNSKTSVIVCSNANPTHVGETVATLRFGERCAMIETSARNNATVLAGVLATIDRKISDLEASIRERERWEIREETREDVLAEAGTVEAAAGGREIKKVYMLVGAEQERKQLNELLRQRAKFTGSMVDKEAFHDDNEEEMQPSEDVNGSSKLPGDNAARRRKVVGFGKEYAEMYGLGTKLDEESEFNAEVDRFVEQADAGAMPMVVRARGATNWVTGQALQQTKELLERKAKKVKRNKLAYSGLSA